MVHIHTFEVEAVVEEVAKQQAVHLMNKQDNLDFVGSCCHIQQQGKVVENLGQADLRSLLGRKMPWTSLIR